MKMKVNMQRREVYVIVWTNLSNPSVEWLSHQKYNEEPFPQQQNHYQPNHCLRFTGLPAIESMTYQPAHPLHSSLDFWPHRWCVSSDQFIIWKSIDPFQSYTVMLIIINTIIFLFSFMCRLKKDTHLLLFLSGHFVTWADLSTSCELRNHQRKVMLGGWFRALDYKCSRGNWYMLFSPCWFNAEWIKWKK